MPKEALLLKIDELLNLDTNNPIPTEKLEHIKWVIEESDQALIPKTSITTALHNLQSAQQYPNDPTRLETFIDTTLAQFVSPWNKKRTKAESQKIIKQLQDEANIAIARTNNDLKDIENNIQKKTGDLAEVQSKLDAIQAKINSESTRLDAMVTNEQAAIAKKKTKIDEDNATFIEKIKEEITDNAKVTIGHFQKKLDGEIANLKEKISDLKNESVADREKIKELLNISSDESLTKDYSDLSNEEKAPANRWSWLAAICFACIPITAILSAAFLGVPETVSLNSLLVRYSLPFSFLILGIYASKKSSHHRDTHLRAKRTHIRFSTLEPYLEKFTPEKRDEIRKELIGEFFMEKESEKAKSPMFGLSFKQVNKLIEHIKTTPKL